jgi:hypothetical protein
MERQTGNHGMGLLAADLSSNARCVAHAAARARRDGIEPRRQRWRMDRQRHADRTGFASAILAYVIGIFGLKVPQLFPVFIAAGGLIFNCGIAGNISHGVSRRPYRAGEPARSE